jgi:hypothetical protein
VAKKGMKIWILSTLTVASLIHSIDAAFAFISNSQVQLPKIYPFIGAYLGQIPTDIYLYTTIAITIVMWGLTCLIACNNPIEAFLNKTLTDAQEQTANEQKIMEENSSFFEQIYQSMDESTRELGKTNDLVLNLRTEVKDMQNMKETFEKARGELAGLKKQVRMLEEKLIFPLLCKACGKPLRADFRLCPYCGQEVGIKKVYVANRLDIDK